jgi:phage-related holin
MFHIKGATIAWAGILLGLDFIAKPSLDLLSVVGAMVFLDLVTGVTKAKFQKKERTSEGFRKTITKLMQYSIPVVALWFGSKRIPEYANMLRGFSGFLMMFIIYVEATSILENLYAIDQRSMLSKYLYKPVLTLLKFGIEKNPVSEAADKIKTNENGSNSVGASNNM